MRNTALVFALALSFPHGASAQNAVERLKEAPFGRMPDGSVVKRFTLRNGNGMSASIITYGAIVTELRVPDRQGNTINVVHGADSLEPYLAGFPAAAVIGRVANRIADARFSIDGVEYRVTVNNRGKHHIHGGDRGFAKVLWQAEALPPSEAESSVRLTYRSVDGEDGYPGNVVASVIYTLTDQDEFRIRYTAATDRATIINMTNHAYFDLGGDGDLSRHELWIDADHYTPTDDDLIPTGVVASVANTPLDFTIPQFLGARADQIREPVRGFYDHNFVFNAPADPVGDEAPGLPLVARVEEARSGIVMEVRTDRPAVQLYTGNPVGFCLETQMFPDAINHENFPSPIVRPDSPFESTTLFSFSAN